ncbi:cyclin-A2-like [Corticium candelabrum]|uniref:cyclin-A2-like n=1 Tax=Corticium candelabrum TaxID=121492 RepID=UPI002E26A22C|nr:cyclin-A2-like [Corticium candelabrum]
MNQTRRKRNELADTSEGSSATKRVALGTLRPSDLQRRKQVVSKVAVSRTRLTTFDNKENDYWKQALGLESKKEEVDAAEPKLDSMTSSRFLSIASRGLGSLPMRVPREDVERRQSGSSMENEALMSSERVSLSDLSFQLPQSTSLFSPASPMVVCNTPTEFVTTESPCLVPLTIPDVDRERIHDVTMCSEYAKEIYDYMILQEPKFMSNPSYMKKQPDITNAMRSILVDWLVEVADEYKLQAQTLYLAISYIDRFLSKMSVMRGKLQLVGAASMFVAAKFEEIHPPEVDEFVYITDDTYTRSQVLKMEHLLLKVLTFDLAAPTILNFLDRYVTVAGANERTEHLAKYLAELSLLDGDPYLKYPPSVIAASSVALALHTFSLPAWTPTLVHYSGYATGDVQACLQDLHCTFSHAPRHHQQAIRDKYSQARFSSVARIPPSSTLPI